MGRPVLVSDLGGAPEIIDHGATGWRVPPGDSAAWARALDHALALTPEQRAALGERARARIQQGFSLAAMAEATFDLYGRLCQRTRP